MRKSTPFVWVLQILAEEALVRSPDHIGPEDLWSFARRRRSFREQQLDHLVVCPTCVEIALLLHRNRD